VIVDIAIVTCMEPGDNDIDMLKQFLIWVDCDEVLKRNLTIKPAVEMNIIEAF